MAKSELSLHGGEYALVADRITLFYARHPTGRIITELVSRSDQEITFRALVYRAAEDDVPAATGWASEREGDGEVNTVACLENTETSAIGRALANLGFTAAMRRPSAEEMAKAARARARAPAASAVREPSAPYEARQEHANAVSDLLALLDSAEREGMRASKVTGLRQRVMQETASREELETVERGLREWLARRVSRRLAGPVTEE